MAVTSQERRLLVARPNMPRIEELSPFFAEVLASGQISNGGPQVTAFEQAAPGAFFDQPVTCVATSSGTAAIEVALQSLPLRPGSRVLLPAFGFCATAAAVAKAGHVPLFADVDHVRWELTPQIADRALATIDVHAVLTVSPFGYALDAAAWARWSEERSVPVVVDAAAGLGNQRRCDGLPIAFSMHATKPFAVGEGGLLAVQNDEQAQDLRVLSNFGMVDRIAYRVGGNAKMSEWHGAVAVAQLRRWTEIRSAVARVRDWYREGIGGLSLETHPDAWTCPAPAFMPVRFSDERRACAAVGELAAIGIEARRWFYPALSAHPAYRSAVPATTLESAHDIAATTVCLPLHSFVEQPDVDVIMRTLEWIA